MQTRIVSLFLLLLLSFSKMKAQDAYDVRAKNYVSQYSDLAIEEQRRSGVPAAITLAQGIHETSGGQSELADNANNHFGIKCRSDWTGQTYSYTDDRPHECFRKYDRVLDSYRDHSDYLANSPRYASLFKLAVTDYTNWAKGLKNLGYATNPRYAQILIKLVEDYGLQEFTLAALKPFKKQNKEQDTRTFAAAYTPQQNAKTAPKEENKKVTTTNTTSTKKSMSVSYDQVVSEPVYRYEPTTEPEVEKSSVPTTDGAETLVNGMRAFFAKKGTMLLNDAIRFNLRYAKLLEYNDLLDAPLVADMFVYLERKKAVGQTETHVVKKGETLFLISQKEGMQMRALRALNHMEINEEPAVGTTLQLMTVAATKPSVIVKPINTQPSVSRIVLADTSKKSNTKTDDGFIAKKEIEKTKPTTITKLEVKKETASVTKPTAKETNTITQKGEEKKPEVVVVKNTPEIVVPVETIVQTPVPQAENKKQERPKNTDPSLNAYIRQAMEEASKDSKDEFALLKEKLDKVVYANGNPIDEEDNTDSTVNSQLTPNDAMPANAEYYTVQKGETVFSIAKKFSLSMQQLQDMNKLDFNEIKTGQKLRVK
jgi:LysM repeat protein